MPDQATTDALDEQLAALFAIESDEGEDSLDLESLTLSDHYARLLALSEARRHISQARAQDALTLKLTEEASQLAAERGKIQEETRQAAALARVAECEAENSEVLARKLQRDEANELARDEYVHRYWFDSSVGSTSVKNCIHKLTQWARQNPEGCDIELVFLSPGGSIIDGMALFDFIQEIRRQGHRVTTMTRGYAASMAGILLQAGDHRTMGKESWLLIHEASFGAGGKIGEVEDTVEWVKKVCERIVDIFVERSKGKMTRTKLKANWLRKDWWISSEDALKFGFIDEIV